MIIVLVMISILKENAISLNFDKIMSAFTLDNLHNVCKILLYILAIVGP